MADKRYALELDNSEWKEYIEKGLEEPKFRADQICQWLWQKHTDDTEEMTNLSKPLREKLAEKMDFAYPTLAREQRSQDGTRKFLWQLRDGESVESVLMKYSDRLTACISTQVGCPLQCTFCATGLSGFVRNLSAGEIAGQVLAIEKHIGREVNNVVYMGMGEPFLNTDAVLKSVRMLNDPKLRSLGIRHITISTSGVIPGIKALSASGLGVRLAVSLHAAGDELRSFLMPVNQTYPAADLRRAMQEYQESTGDRVTIEYALFGGVNDSVERARELVRFLKGIHVFVNLIPFNAVDGRYEKPKAEDVLRFRNILQTAGFETEIRSEQGADIDAACGQLTVGGGSAPLEAPAYSLTKADMTPEKRRERPAAAAADPRKEGLPRREASKKTPLKPSGGFVAERGKRRKSDRDPQERYRSGKMKEARPSYRGDGEETPRSLRRDARPERESIQKQEAFPKKSSDEKRGGDKKELRGAAAGRTAGKKTSARTKRGSDNKPQGAFSKFYGASGGKAKRSKKS
ncbi:MAG: 23S rRNA (adenine(2503)-C(2))-methyltransferase RlmN [Cloacibacillus porcorum]|nr:23S rRNA (adenine(2503)-C(2))-methyltransferase RlmN [Cloacibacillus porcorum]